MKDKNGIELKVGDKVEVLGKAGTAWLGGRALGARPDEHSFPATVVGFAGADRVIVEEVTSGPRYSLISEQLERAAIEDEPEHES